MKTCKTCKWWARNYHPGTNNAADCSFHTMGTPRGDASGVAYIQASATDNQGLEAEFFTGENFGCTSHAEKEKTE